MTGTKVPCKARSSRWANLGTESRLYLTARNGASQVQVQSPATQVAHCTQRSRESKESRPARTGRSRLGCLGPFRQQEAVEHSRACLLIPGGRRLLRQGVAGLHMHRTVWLCGRRIRQREGVHMGGILGIWPRYGRCPLAGAAAAAACRCSGVWWDGHGKERSFQVPRALH